MRIIDRFSLEHQTFVIELDALRTDVAAGGDIAAAIARVRALAGPLLRHAENEEVLLFPDLVAQLGGEEGGPVGVLRREHSIIHGQVDTLRGEPTAADFTRVFAAFDALLRAHIDKEEEILFPLAGQLLGDVRLAQLDEEIAAAV
jgi:iron-sulfur cluster repair protein YtfE (RIC family)